MAARFKQTLGRERERDYVRLMRLWKTRERNGERARDTSRKREGDAGGEKNQNGENSHE